MRLGISRSSGGGWGEELAGGAGGAGQVVVEGGQGAGQGLGQGHVPGVVAGQVVSQGPDTVSERGEREQLEIEPQQVIVADRGLGAGDGPGLFQSPQDVGCLGQGQLGGRQGASGNHRFGPDSVGS